MKKLVSRKVLSVLLRGPLIIYSVAILITIIWFRQGLLIAHGEIGFFFMNPGRMVHNSFFTWFEIDGLGYANAQQLVLMPFQFIMLILSRLGVSTVMRQAGTLFFLLAVSGISMLRLTEFLIKDETQRLAGIVAGLVYIMNPYMLLVWNRFNSIIFLPAFLPLLVLLYLKGLEDKSRLWSLALYINLTLFMALPAFPNPTYLLTYVIVFAAIFLFYIIQNIRNLSQLIHIITFSAVTAAIGIMLNFWWLLPVAFNMSNAMQSASLINPVDTLLEVSTKYYSLDYIIRLFAGYSYNWQFLKHSFLYLTITFFLPILAFSAILLKKTKQVIFFTCLALFGLFTATGSAPPFGNIFLEIFKSSSFLAGFRDTFNKVGIIISLSYAFLGGVTISSIYFISQSKLKKQKLIQILIVAVLILIAVLPSAITMFSGAVFRPAPGEQNPILKISYYAKIPYSYKQADNWMSKQDGDFRVVAFPISPHDYLAYDWESGYHGIRLLNVWSRPMIEGQTWKNDIDLISNKINRLINTHQFWRIMAILNAKYALVHKDAFYHIPWHPYPPDEYDIFLQNVTVPDFSSAPQNQYFQGLSWASIKSPEHRIEIVNVESTKNKTLAKVISDMKGELNWEGGIEFRFDTVKDLSNYSFFSFDIKFESLENVRNAYFQLGDINGNYKKWRITDSIADSFIPITISPDRQKGDWESPHPVNLSLVKTLQITVEKEGGIVEPIVWWVDCNFKSASENTLKQAHIAHAKTFGGLTFYGVDKDFFLPVIFSTNQFIFTQTHHTMLNLLALGDVDPRDQTIFCRTQLSKPEFQLLDSFGSDEPHGHALTYEKVDPTKYVVKVKNASKAFLIVFSSTYDKNWKMYPGNPDFFGILFRKASAIQYHPIANCYANSWILEPEKICREQSSACKRYSDGTMDFELVLQFWPQVLVYVGLYVSVIFFLLYIIFLYYLRKRKKQGFYIQSSN